MDRKKKQPREELDFDFPCDRAISDDDKINAVAVSYTGPDDVLVISHISWDDTTPKVWIMGGSDGAEYKITIVINTDGGRIIEGDMLLYVKDI